MFFLRCLHGERVQTASHYLSYIFTTLGKNNNDPPCNIKNVLVLQLLFSLYLILLVTLNFLSFESEQYKRLNTYQGGKSCICKKACEFFGWDHLGNRLSSSILSIYPFKFNSSPFLGSLYLQEMGRRFQYTISTVKFFYKNICEIGILFVCVFQYRSFDEVRDIDNSKIAIF